MYTNGHPQAHPTRANQDREPIVVVAVPAVSLVGSRLVVGDSSSTSTRSYTPLKVVGDGSFGTVWLCDWHGLLPPNTSLSPMQCGAGARPEWAGKRLVAVKRMKKRWEGGWEECKKLKELEALRAIPPHPNLIPLYDFFLLPSSKELYFVFESMEGNLYQLIKSRKNRPLAGGLVSSIFRQVVLGLHHIHVSGYFHRDMKPENLLVTTTGLADYISVSPIAPPNAPPEKDVVVIIKLADFGLARETASKPPYTEYVSTRWYRAPEVLLHSRDYSNPVDLWALGTIMVELVNLRPLFPGQGEIDQVIRICQCLGDPSDEYGVDVRGKSIGGGPWPRGVKLAGKVGFIFPKHIPVPFNTLFEPSVPPSLVECINDLLKYDPAQRLTTLQCVEHRYLAETAISQPQAIPPPQLSITTSSLTPPSSQVNLLRNGRSPVVPCALASVSPRSLPPSHSQPGAIFPNATVNGKLHLNGSAHPGHPQVPDVSSPQRVPFYQRPADELPTPLLIPAHSPSPGDSHIRSAASELANQLRDMEMQGVEQSPEAMFSPSPLSTSGYGGENRSTVPISWSQISPKDATWEQAHAGFHSQNGAHMHIRNGGEDDLARSMDHDMIHDPNQTGAGHHHMNGANNHSKTGKFPSLTLGNKKRGWGFGSMFGSHDKMQQPPLPPVDELNVASSNSTPSLKRTQSGSTDSHSLPDISPTGPIPPSVVITSAADQKRIKKEAERMARDAEKQRRILADKAYREQARAVMQKRNQLMKGSERVNIEWMNLQRSGVEKPTLPVKGKNTMPPAVMPAGGMYNGMEQQPWEEHRRLSEQDDHRWKSRRLDIDDDVSSSSDLQSVSRMSMISFATVDSDPGPARARHRPSPYNAISRATSYSSLRQGSSRALSPSARSSTSLEGQLVNDFNELATFGSPPPPMRQLSPNGHAHHWQEMGNGSYSDLQHTPNGHGNGSLTLPPVSSFDNLQQLRVPGPNSSYDYGIGSVPSSPSLSPALHPMFQVPASVQHHKLSQTLPPFSHLASVAEQHHEQSSMLPPIQDVHIAEPDDPDPPG